MGQSALKRLIRSDSRLASCVSSATEQVVASMAEIEDVTRLGLGSARKRVDLLNDGACRAVVRRQHRRQSVRREHMRVDRFQRRLFLRRAVAPSRELDLGTNRHGRTFDVEPDLPALRGVGLLGR